MPIPIALQLYTVRDELLKDFDKTLEQVAAMGYRHVEMAGLYNRSAAEVRKQLDKLKLSACAMHSGLDPLMNKVDSVIADAKALGLQYVVVPAIFESQRNPEGYKQVLNTLNNIGAKMNAAGLQLCYHNHAFEFTMHEGGVRGIDVLYEHANKNKFQAELDVFWVQHGGDQPVAWIKKLSGRVPLLHIKDMAAGPEKNFAEVGTGIMDMKAVVAAAPAAGVKYFIIEQDRGWMNGNPLESVQVSLQNFTKVAG